MKSKRRRRSDYQVGYRKPPRRSQFKPGQSGNPRGRPKGRKNEDTILASTTAGNERCVGYPTGESP